MTEIERHRESWKGETDEWLFNRLANELKDKVEEIGRLKNEHRDNFKCYFSFAKYLNENFEYFDNTRVGDVYKDKEGKGLYSEFDIYDEWLNNGKGC